MRIDNIRYGTYGIRFHESGRKDTANIWSIGLEQQTSSAYDWNGRKREEEDVYVFQYTLAGKGMLEIMGESFELKPGQGFFVSIPGDHRYYLPEDGSWSFIYITLLGREAADCWQYIHEKTGPVAAIPREKTVIQKLFSLYEQVQQEYITDKYAASAEAYGFLMECRRFFSGLDAGNEQAPASILKARDYMASHFDRQLDLENCAKAAGLSKYHFTRKFREYMGISPSKYLVKLRMEKAVELLRFTDMAVKEIAVRTGYTDPNYFHKVFRKYAGVSAMELRNGIKIPAVDHLRFMK